jgi:hypothetical protein
MSFYSGQFSQSTACFRISFASSVEAVQFSHISSENGEIRPGTTLAWALDLAFINAKLISTNQSAASVSLPLS